MKTKLFEPLEIRSTQFKNRIFVSPMCQYSAVDGVAQPWHMVHLGSRAVGGAGLVIFEATGVEPEGRITPGCLGLWSEKHMLAVKPIVEFIQSQGAKAGIQLAHAGRKASVDLPWNGGKELSPAQGGWQTIGPSAVKFADGYTTPREMTKTDMKNVIAKFVKAADLALHAGFDLVEVHGAHGYLIHEFLSPLSNFRKDEYGGSLENRMRFPLELVRAVRDFWPKEKPLFVRISATDWVENGWDENQSVTFCKELKKIGVDLIDCSTGGNVSHPKIPNTPGYQVPFAEKIRKEANVLTGAVGLITEAKQAHEILESGKADVVLLAREFLRDPYFAIHAARELGVEVKIPNQYLRSI